MKRARHFKVMRSFPSEMNVKIMQSKGAFSGRCSWPKVQWLLTD